MQENIGATDLTIRVLLSAGLAGLAFAFAADLRVSTPAALAAVWLAGTVLTRRCPLYRVFHLSTHSTGRRHREP